MLSVFRTLPIALLTSVATALPWLIAAAAVGGALVIGVLWTRRLRKAETRARHAERKARLGLARSERDHARLAQVLHDGPVQDLLALDLETRVAAHLGLPDQGGDVSAIVCQLRAVSEGLRPPALGPFGLAAALTAHVERLRRSPPPITVSLDLDDDDLPVGTRLALFRIAQEAIGNAALHAPPVQVEVRLETSDAGAELTIRDDGQGWEVPDDLSALAPSGQFGVFGMLTQAESVGATLTVRSTSDGTVVSVTAPPVLPNWA